MESRPVVSPEMRPPVVRSHMGWTDALRICVTEKYATFTGRASRAEFWKFNCWMWLISSVLNALTPILPMVMIVLLFVFSLGFFLPSMAVTVRRFHDIGKSGWWVLFPVAVAMIAGSLMVVMIQSEDVSPVAAGVLGLVYLGVIILMWYWWCKPSQPGPNRYGEQPPETVATGGEV